MSGAPSPDDPPAFGEMQGAKRRNCEPASVYTKSATWIKKSKPIGLVLIRRFANFGSGLFLLPIFVIIERMMKMDNYKKLLHEREPF